MWIMMKSAIVAYKDEVIENLSNIENSVSFQYSQFSAVTIFKVPCLTDTDSSNLCNLYSSNNTR